MPVPANRVPVRVARGTYAILSAEIASLQEGEVCYATDQDRLYVVEGGALVATGANLGTASVGDLGDVTLDTPSEFDGLVYDGVQWVNMALPIQEGITPGILMDFDGGNGSTTFTESTGKITTWTPIGGAAQSTTQVKYGTSSFIGSKASSRWLQSGNLLNTSAAKVFDVGTGDFTFEFWMYLPTGSTTSFQNVFAVERADGNAGTIACTVRKEAASGSVDALVVNVGTGADTGSAVVNLQSTALYSYDTWHHVAVCRASGTLKAYVDGVQKASVANTTSIGGNAAMTSMYLNIGRNVPGTGEYYDGFLDNMYWVNTAKYTTAFTPGQALAVPPIIIAGSIGDLNDVDDAASDPVDGDVLRWNDAAGKWKPTTAPVSSVNLRQGAVSLAITDLKGVYSENERFAAEAASDTAAQNTAGTYFVYDYAFGNRGIFLNRYDKYGRDVLALFPPGFLFGNGGSSGQVRLSSTSGTGYTNYTFLYATNSEGSQIPTNPTWVKLVMDNQTIPSTGLGDRYFILSTTPDTTPTEGKALVWDGLKWSPGDRLLDNIGDVAVNPAGSKFGWVMNWEGINNQAAGYYNEGIFPYSNFTFNSCNLSTDYKKFGNTSLKLTNGFAFFKTQADLGSTGTSTLAFGTGDFTIECWVLWPTIPTGSLNVLAEYNNSTVDIGWLIYFNGASSFFTINLDGVAEHNTSVVSPTAATWHHVAVTRSAGTLRAFFNGTQVLSVANSTNIETSTARYLTIGGGRSAGQNLNGYMDGFRVVAGTALYTSAFTPPTSAPSKIVDVANGKVLTWNDSAKYWEPQTPTADAVSSVAGKTGAVTLELIDSTDVGLPTTAPTLPANTVVAITGAGTNGATTFTNIGNGSSGNGTAVGNAQISNAQSKFYGTSLAFDGSGDAITIAHHDEQNLGGNDFTVQFWVRFNVLTNGLSYAFAGKANAAATDNGWTFRYAHSSTGNTDFWYVRTSNGFSQSTEQFVYTGNRLAINTWYHVRLCQFGGSAYCFLDGQNIGGAQATGVFEWASTAALRIGAMYNDNSNPINGYINDFQIINGTALSTSTASFTPPTTGLGSPVPVPPSDGQVLTYVGANSQWEPANLGGAAVRTALGIGSYVDDTAAGSGGVASGALYYNTTSSDYRLKS